MNLAVALERHRTNRSGRRRLLQSKCLGLPEPRPESQRVRASRTPCATIRTAGGMGSSKAATAPSAQSVRSTAVRLAETRRRARALTPAVMEQLIIQLRQDLSLRHPRRRRRAHGHRCGAGGHRAALAHAQHVLLVAVRTWSACGTGASLLAPPGAARHRSRAHQPGDQPL